MQKRDEKREYTPEEIRKIKQDYINENGFGSHEPPDDIPCRTCLYRMPPIKIDGEYYHQYKKVKCAVYEFRKPIEVLRKEQECQYYKEDPDAGKLEEAIAEYNKTRQGE